MYRQGTLPDDHEPSKWTRQYRFDQPGQRRQSFKKWFMVFLSIRLFLFRASSFSYIIMRFINNNRRISGFCLLVKKKSFILID